MNKTYEWEKNSQYISKESGTQEKNKKIAVAKINSLKKMLTTQKFGKFFYQAENEFSKKNISAFSNSEKKSNIDNYQTQRNSKPNEIKSLLKDFLSSERSNITSFQNHSNNSPQSKKRIVLNSLTESRELPESSNFARTDISYLLRRKSFPIRNFLTKENLTKTLDEVESNFQDLLQKLKVSHYEDLNKKENTPCLSEFENTLIKGIRKENPNFLTLNPSSFAEINLHISHLLKFSKMFSNDQNLSFSREKLCVLLKVFIKDIVCQISVNHSEIGEILTLLIMILEKSYKDKIEEQISLFRKEREEYMKNKDEEVNFYKREIKFEREKLDRANEQMQKMDKISEIRFSETEGNLRLKEKLNEIQSQLLCDSKKQILCLNEKIGELIRELEKKKNLEFEMNKIQIKMENLTEGKNLDFYGSNSILSKRFLAEPQDFVENLERKPKEKFSYHYKGQILEDQNLDFLDKILKTTTNFVLNEESNGNSNTEKESSHLIDNKKHFEPVDHTFIQLLKEKFHIEEKVCIDHYVQTENDEGRYLKPETSLKKLSKHLKDGSLIESDLSIQFKVVDRNRGRLTTIDTKNSLSPRRIRNSQVDLTRNSIKEKQKGFKKVLLDSKFQTELKNDNSISISNRSSSVRKKTTKYFKAEKTNYDKIGYFEKISELKTFIVEMQMIIDSYIIQSSGNTTVSITNIFQNFKNDYEKLKDFESSSFINLLNISQQNSSKRFDEKEYFDKIQAHYNDTTKEIIELVIQKHKVIKIPKSFIYPQKTLFKEINCLYEDYLSFLNKGNNIQSVSILAYYYNQTLSLNNFDRVISQRKLFLFIYNVINNLTNFKISMFARLSGLLEPSMNYSIDEIKRFFESYQYLTITSKTGFSIPFKESDDKRLIPLVRALEFMKIITENTGGKEVTTLRRDIEFIREKDPYNLNKIGCIALEDLVSKIIVWHRFNLRKTKSNVLVAFKAADLDDNKKLSIKEFKILFRNIEPEKYQVALTEKIFNDSADLKEDDELFLSFEAFVETSMKFGLFSEEKQDIFLSTRSSEDVKNGVMIIKENKDFCKKQLEDKLIGIKERGFSEEFEYWNENLFAFENNLETIESSSDFYFLKAMLLIYKIMNVEMDLIFKISNINED